MSPRADRAVGRPWPDARIADVAGGQRTLITRAQLLAMGVGRQSIVRARARSRLHMIHFGVYSLVPRSALPELALEQAALLACGPDAVLSHHSAAALWGLCAPAPRSRPVSVTVIGGQAGRTRPGIEVHRAVAIDRRDVRRHRSLAVTSPARTLFDRAPSLGRAQLERELDEALHHRLTSRTAIAEMLDRSPSRPGAARLRELIDPDRHTTFTRAESERRLLALVRKGGLPLPETNVRMDDIEADAMWRDQRVIVEVDGFATHGTHAAFTSDRRRDARLQILGWQVIRVTWDQLVHEPEAVLVTLATALALRP
jgi:very-short-patch-repair endonuclease